jgi:hypothetical protein
MKRALLALAAVACVSIPAGQAFGQTPVERIRKACVETNMQRDAFERLLGGRGLQPLLQVVREGDNWELFNWMVGYGDGDVQIAIEGKTADPARATECGVIDPAPSGDWRREVAAFARELGMSPTAPLKLPDVSESRAWAAPHNPDLVLSYAVYREAVVVQFERRASSSQ